MDRDELARQAQRMLDKTTADLETSWAMEDPEWEERVMLFRHSAREFCDFIDGIVKGTHPHLYADLLRLLTQLAAAGLALPPCGESGDGEYGDMRLSHEDWQNVGRAIGSATASAVGELIDDAEGDDPDAQRASMLWDDLAGIYVDLKSGIRVLDLGTDDAKADAVWQWRFDYESHWGTHLFSALQTVHAIRFRLIAD